MQNKKKWYDIKPVNGTRKADIFLYNEIGFFGISASQFIMDLDAMGDMEELNIHINSPGGDVFDGIAIYNTLLRQKGNVNIHIEGIAASIASVIAMAGKKVSMYETAMFMVHKPWTVAVGDADQLNKDAEVLNKIQEAITKAYQSKAKGLSDKDIQDLIDEESWMTAEDAKEWGFVDEIVSRTDEEKTQDNTLNDSCVIVNFNQTLQKYKNLPKRMAALVTGCPAHAEKKEAGTQSEPINNKPKENQMTEEEKKAAAAVQAEAELKIRAEATTAERKRIADIKASGNALKVAEDVIESCVKDGLSVSDANAKFIAKVQETMKPLSENNSIHVGVDDSQKFHALAVDSIMDSVEPLKDEKRRDAVRAAGEEFAPRSLHGLLRVVLRRAGVRGVDTMVESRLVDSAFEHRPRNAASGSTGDFTSILANVANKFLENGMARAAVTFPIWTKTKSVKDFRQVTAASMSDFSDVEIIPEGAAPVHGSFTDKKEVGTLRTNGKIYTITRQALTNDDLGAFTDIPMKMGMAIQDAQEKECYDFLYGSAGEGPTMTEDSLELFDATAVASGGHGNYVTSGATVSSTTLDVGIKAIMTAPRMKGNPKDATRPTGAMPKFLIVPPGLLSTAYILVSSMSLPTAQYSSGVINPYGASGMVPLQLICPAYLSALDATGWYLATDPNQVGTLTRLTLTGKESPTMIQAENQIGQPLGISFHIYYDWRFMVSDWRGMFYNDGE